MDTGKPRAQLIEELGTLRRRVAELERLGVKRKKVEEQLTQLEKRYRGALDNMLEGCQIIGFDWRYLYLNDAAAGHGHSTKEELLGHTMMEMYPSIDNTEMFAHLQHCMKDRLPHTMENEFTFPDGAKGWFELSIEPVPQGVLVLSQDITERKRAEERMTHLNSVLRALRNVNQLITHERDRGRLIQKSCDLLIESRGYTRAWILLVDEDRNFVSAASAGVGEQLPILMKELRQSKYPPCVSQVLEQEQSLAIYDDVSNQCKECRLAESHRQRSAFMGGLEYDGKTYGMINVNVSSELGSD